MPQYQKKKHEETKQGLCRDFCIRNFSILEIRYYNSSI